MTQAPIDKVWLKSYPDGVPAEINPDEYQSLVHMFEESVSKFANHVAYKNKFANDLSYGDLDKLSKDFAAYLQNDVGIQKGDAVAIMMPNLIQYPVALFGILRAGAAVVNVNPMYTPRELEHQMNDSGAKAIVIIENTCHTLEKVIANTGVKQVITTQIADMASFPKSLMVNTIVKRVKKLVPAWNLPGAISFKAAIAKGAKQTFNHVELTGDDTSFLQYTGGTTGRSKGAVLSHRNLIANVFQIRAWFDQATFEDGKELIVTALPLYHIYALCNNCLIFFSYGGTNLLVTDPRDTKAFIDELKEVKMTAITGVNTLFNAMVNEPSLKEVDFSGLKLTSGGGAAVQVEVSRKWREITGQPIIEGYGLTESSPVATVNRPDITAHTGNCGLPVPSTEVCTMDGDLNILPIGERGELCIRGPQVMQGYLNRPDATAETITPDGWLRTGDVAIIDENGYVKIVDRLKDMILVSGFNVFPNEIEDVVAQHPAVLEVACIGVPHESAGEMVKIYVVKHDANDGVTEDDIRNYCRENLTGYKVPKLVEFRIELPKSNVGKILRKDLRAEEEAKQG